MDLKEILLRKIDSVLNPKLENRIILVFLSLGSLLVGVPSIMAVSAVLSVKSGGTTFTAEISNGPDMTMIVLGVMCLVTSVYFFERKRMREGNQNIEKLSVVDEKDKITIRRILESINTHVIDEAIERGCLSQFYYPVIHYYYGIEGLAKSSSFAIYNNELKSLFENFYHSFDSLTSHGAHFREAAHPDLYRFLKPHEVGDYRKHEENERNYRTDVEKFAKAFRAFISHVKREYPDIDLTHTNQVASNDYAKYNTKQQG